MALVDALRAGIAVADSLTDAGGLQETVKHYAALGTLDKNGQQQLSTTAVERQAIVEQKQRRMINSDSQEVNSTHRVFFPRPTAIGPFDELELADGKRRPILRLDGVDDGLLGTPYYREVWLG